MRMGKWSYDGQGLGTLATVLRFKRCFYFGLLYYQFSMQDQNETMLL